MKTGINIGVTKETVVETKQAILSIINSDNAEGVKIEALQTLRTICQIKDTVISNNYIGDK